MYTLSRLLKKSFEYCRGADSVGYVGFFEEENSGLVLFETKDAYANYITEKTADGWKISNTNTYEIECTKTKNNHAIVVYHIKDTPDRYVLISTDFTDKISEITDSQGEEFRHVRDEATAHTTYFYCYSGDDFDYTVFINGEKVVLK